jgi:hypothetical protein
MQGCGIPPSQHSNRANLKGKSRDGRQKWDAEELLEEMTASWILLDRDSEATRAHDHLVPSQPL